MKENVRDVTKKKGLKIQLPRETVVGTLEKPQEKDAASGFASTAGGLTSDNWGCGTEFY